MSEHRKSALTIIQTGLLSLLVDGGRNGLARQGITQSGAVDFYGFSWVNRLLGNPVNACCIEVAGGGLQAKVSDDCVIAVTGAPMPLLINHKSVPLWCSHRLKAGDRISLQMAEKGLRAYLAVAGGFKVNPCFNSVSTSMREGIGGLKGDGKPLAPADKVPFTPCSVDSLLKAAPASIPEFPASLRLRIIPGYQYAQFSVSAQARVFSQTFTVSARMDRMGVRLIGRAIASPQGPMHSEGICLGAVQIPPDGQPIVMLNDRQSIGGYAKIGSVLSLDCARLAQATPGTEVYFEQIDMFRANNLLHLHQAQYERAKPIPC